MDILRHTAISMHLAAHSNEGLTAAWAGNSPDIIQRHYKGLVRPADASDFWQIGAGPVVVEMLEIGLKTGKNPPKINALG